MCDLVYQTIGEVKNTSTSIDTYVLVTPEDKDSDLTEAKVLAEVTEVYSFDSTTPGSWFTQSIQVMTESENKFVVRISYRRDC